MAAIGPSSGVYGRDAIKKARRAANSSSNSTGTKTPTTIYDPDGTGRSGYIQGGQTYYDDGSRISVGSTVTDNSGREWKMTESGGVATGNVYGLQGNARNTGGNRSIGRTGAITASDYYTKALEEQQRAIQERTNQAVEANNAYIPQINQQSKQALQNSYIAREQARVRTPQALNALGYTGGAAESTLLGLDTNYQNARGTIEQERSRALEGIRQNEAQIRATGDATLSEASASYYNKLAAAVLEAERQAQDQANWESEFALQQQQYSDAAAQQAWQNAYDDRLYALQMADAGKSTGSSYGGVTEEQINRVSAPSGIRQSVGAVAQGLTPQNYTYRDVYNSIVPNRTPEGVRAAAQRLLAQGANPSYVEDALRALGYQ